MKVRSRSPKSQEFQPELSISENPQKMGEAAAKFVGEQMRRFIKQNGKVVMNLAAAPSQDEFYESLLKQKGIDWSKVVIVHLDEYDMKPDDPHSFKTYLKNHIISEAMKKGLKKENVHFIAEAPGRTMREKCANYERIMKKIGRVNIVCIGIGENGHLGFNDPPVANFKDKKFMKIVKMDEACRRQQLRDYRGTPFDYGTLENVPQYAMTMTLPAILSAEVVSVVVKGPQKADAVKGALEGPISTECPASGLRMRPAVRMFVDKAAASKLNRAA